MSSSSVSKLFRVGIVGATGAVGKEMLEIMASRQFPTEMIRPFASERSKGKPISFLGKQYACEILQKGCFDGLDIVFFDASDEISKAWVQEAASAGAWVVDNSATYRMDPEVSLCVPEINGRQTLERLGNTHGWKSKVVAGPNCSTVQLVQVLKPLQDRFGIKRVVVSTYQSVSGAGAQAITDLRDELAFELGAIKSKPQQSTFSHPIAFNLIPHIGGAKANGYTSEELKVIDESRKILSLPGLKITATAIRVPTERTHAESVNVELSKPFDSIKQIQDTIASQPGVTLQDDLENKIYPMSRVARGDFEGAYGKDPVFVGRIRRDDSVENGLNLWVVSDNLRKGAALNAIQIGEMLVK